MIDPADYWPWNIVKVGQYYRCEHISTVRCIGCHGRLYFMKVLEKLVDSVGGDRGGRLVKCHYLDTEGYDLEGNINLGKCRRFIPITEDQFEVLKVCLASQK